MAFTYTPVHAHYKKKLNPPLASAKEQKGGGVSPHGWLIIYCNTMGSIVLNNVPGKNS